jgi:hypothetical protein
MDTLDPIFNMYKVKFDTLDSWNILKRDTRRAFVYINLEEVLRQIINAHTNAFVRASASVDEEVDFTNRYTRAIVSNIINLGQHYRLWLVKHGIESRIIIYWNYPIPEHYKNEKYIPTYRATHNARYQSSMEMEAILGCLEDAYEFLTTCIQYVNEVYCINPLGVESSLVPLVLDQKIYQENNVPTQKFIVSKSLYDFSYVNYGFQVIAPYNKTKRLITQQNAIDSMKTILRVSSTISTSSNFIECINAFIGDSDRSIPQLLNGVGIVGVIRKILEAIRDGRISEHTKDGEMLASMLSEDYQEIFLRNYYCTSLEHQLREVEPVEIHKIKSCLVDNYDETTLAEMNEKYFKADPIEIVRPRSAQIYSDRTSYTDDYRSPAESIFSR